MAEIMGLKGRNTEEENKEVRDIFLDLVGSMLPPALEVPSVGEEYYPEGESPEDIMNIAAAGLGTTYGLSVAMDRIRLAVEQGRFDKKFSKQIAKNFKLTPEDSKELFKFGKALEGALLPDGTYDMKKYQRANSMFRNRMGNLARKQDIVKGVFEGDLYDPPVKIQDFERVGNVSGDTNVDELKRQYREGLERKKPVRGQDFERIGEASGGGEGERLKSQYRERLESERAKRVPNERRSRVLNRKRGIFVDLRDGEPVKETVDLGKQYRKTLPDSPQLPSGEGLVPSTEKAKKGSKLFSKIGKKGAIGAGILAALAAIMGYRLYNNKGGGKDKKKNIIDIDGEIEDLTLENDPRLDPALGRLLRSTGKDIELEDELRELNRMRRERIQKERAKR